MELNILAAPCVEWQGALTSQGYGSRKYKGKMVGTHRLAYAAAHGLDPFTMGGVVLHLCDNRKCIEPLHLQLGSSLQNSEDMIAKGRQHKPIGEANGNSKLTDEQRREIQRRYVPHIPNKQRSNSKELQLEFGVSAGRISTIVRQQWN